LNRTLENLKDSCDILAILEKAYYRFILTKKIQTNL